MGDNKGIIGEFIRASCSDIDSNFELPYRIIRYFQLEAGIHPDLGNLDHGRFKTFFKLVTSANYYSQHLNATLSYSFIPRLH